jgi:hypothetical protein
MVRILDHLSTEESGEDELPWQETKEAVLTELVEKLSQLPQEKIIHEIQPIWNRPAVFSRFSASLTDAQRQQVRRQITGVYADLVDAFIGLVTEWYQNKEEEFETEEIEYEVFRYFLEQDEVDTVEFVKMLAFRLARKTGTSLPGFANRLLALSKEKIQDSEIHFFRLAEILEELDWDVVFIQLFQKLSGQKSSAPELQEEATDSESGLREGREEATGSESGLREGREEETGPELEAPILSAGELTLKSKPSVPEPTAEQTEGKEQSGVKSPARVFQSEVKALHYFLLYGTFRPDHPRYSVTQWEARQREWINQQPVLMAQFYRQVLGASSASFRLLDYFSESLVMEVITVLAPGKLESLTAIWADLKLWTELRKPKRGSTEGIKDYYSTILLFLGKQGSAGFQLDAYFDRLLLFVSGQLNISFEELLLDIREVIRKGELRFSAVTLRLMAALANRRQAERTIRTAMAQKASSGTKPKSEVPMEESIFINNAGLVILAPFLPRFFNMVHLTKEKAFLDEAAAVRGALLLHYMVTGETEGPEYEMVLNKIFCGLPIHMPLPAALDITEEEKEVVASMLMGVKTNWSKMENSTVEAMVESFIQREGRLSEEADHWELVVESKAYDILIEFLPWTIGMVKLPWMEKRIEVTWKTKL